MSQIATSLLQGLNLGGDQVMQAAGLAHQMQSLQMQREQYARHLGQEAAAQQANAAMLDQEYPLENIPALLDQPNPEAPAQNARRDAAQQAVGMVGAGLMDAGGQGATGDATAQGVSALQALVPPEARAVLQTPNPQYQQRLALRDSFGRMSPQEQQAFFHGHEHYFAGQREYAAGMKQVQALRRAGFGPDADRMERLLETKRAGMGQQQAMSFGGGDALAQAYGLAQSAVPAERARGLAMIQQWLGRPISGGEAMTLRTRPAGRSAPETIQGVQRGDPQAIAQYEADHGKPPPAGLLPARPKEAGKAAEYQSREQEFDELVPPGAVGEGDESQRGLLRAAYRKRGYLTKDEYDTVFPAEAGDKKAEAGKLLHIIGLNDRAIAQVNHKEENELYNGPKVTPEERDRRDKAQKARDDAYEAYQAIVPSPTSKRKPLNGQAAPDRAAPPAGPAIIRSDAEYDRLPSGAEFTGPDRVKRRKP